MARHQVMDQLATPDSTAVVAARVAQARHRQRSRLAGTPWRRNADVPGGELRRRWPLSGSVTAALSGRERAGRVSARGMDRVVRLAWTLADLRGASEPTRDDVALALSLRDGTALPGGRRSGARPVSWVDQRAADDDSTLDRAVS